MWKNRILYFLFLAGIIVFYIDHSGWISGYTLALTLSMPIFSLICSLPLAFHRQVVVLSQGICQRNEKSEISFVLKTKKRWQIPLCVLTLRIRDLMSGTQNREKVILSNAKHTVVIPTEHCGVYEYKIIRGYAYDFLGLFRFSVKLPEACTVAVNPIASSPELHPDFSSFQAKSYRPKPGGGFSEIHEMREYRPGDPLKSIHWKLSAKTDNLIVREAQEPERQLVLVTIALTADRTKMDAALDELRWVSEQLLNMEISHEVYFNHGDGCKSVSVSSKDDLQELFYEIMSKPVIEDGAVVEYPNADWIYHIDPHRKGEAYEKA